jgi:glycosyltransferase involved in cell wall biosynthesis
VPPVEVGDGTREILFVGSLSYEPNIDAVDWLLDDIWPRVRAAAPRARLNVVGRNPSEAMRQRCRAAAGVRLVGDAPSLDEHYRAARAVIVPIRSGGGTGRIKILEAMAYGIPIVATPQAVEGVAVADGSEVLLAEDADGLARRTSELLSDAAAARAIGHAGREVWARDHAPEAAAGIIGSIVDLVLPAAGQLRGRS